MYWLSQFMAGRRGVDPLTFGLLIVGFIFSQLSYHTGFLLFTILFYLVMLYCLFRVFSRNLPRREAENQAFLRLIHPFQNMIMRFVRRRRERQFHRFFKCPHCKEHLRVPRGKGKISITCPRCGTQFIKTT
ncbi:MAG: hypothetical protein PHT34_06145 [Oscillospiraceae bacterium]|nr:hypothetical protein [Oscillospiraceae bacterium]